MCNIKALISLIPPVKMPFRLRFPRYHISDHVDFDPLVVIQGDACVAQITVSAVSP